MKGKYRSIDSVKQGAVSIATRGQQSKVVKLIEAGPDIYISSGFNKPV